MIVHICSWCSFFMVRTRFHRWLGFDVSHSICRRHAREFMKGKR